MLPAGRYLVVDQDGPASTRLTVAGKTRTGSLPVEATVTGTSTHRWLSPKTLPANGWIRLRNTSDEAHVLVVQKVKRSTTNAQVRRFIHRAVTSGAHTAPPWQLKPSTDSGLFSRRTNVDLHLDLPDGKYLVMCFWPSKDTGMPHFAMGMWKLVNLR